MTAPSTLRQMSLLSLSPLGFGSGRIACATLVGVRRMDLILAGLEPALHEGRAERLHQPPDAPPASPAGNSLIV
jgi:hypothetical protein